MARTWPTLELILPCRAFNSTLWVVVGLAMALLMAAPYVPWVVDVLRFAPLPAHELAAAVALGLLSVVWFERIKWTRRQGRRAGSRAREPASWVIGSS